jgi:hypothetical protein
VRRPPRKIRWLQKHHFLAIEHGTRKLAINLPEGPPGKDPGLFTLVLFPVQSFGSRSHHRPRRPHCLLSHHEHPFQKDFKQNLHPSLLNDCSDEINF